MKIPYQYCNCGYPVPPRALPARKVCRYLHVIFCDFSWFFCSLDRPDQNERSISVEMPHAMA